MDQLNPNIILLTVDAIRADHVSCYGYNRDTTPNLDGWAADNVLFRNTFSASSHTREAVPSLLTGRFPDVFSDNGYQLAADSLPAYLDDSVHAGAFHSNPYVSRAYGFDRDFDVFDDDLHLGQHKLVALAQRALDKLRNRHYARAETINARALSWLDDRPADQPFFLWNHYMDTHGPYYPPSAYRDRFGSPSLSSREAMRLYHKSCRNPNEVTDVERQTQVDLYDAEIAYLDGQLNAFLKALADRALIKNSIVVITADHGDAFGEHGYYGHPRRLDDEVLHVPLVVLDPGDCGHDVTDPVSTLDIVPTLLDAVGAPVPELPGQSLQRYYGGGDAPERPFVFSQARGKGDDSHRRRYRAQGVNDRATATADLDAGEWTLEASTTEAAAIALSEHVRERPARDDKRIAAETGDGTDEDVQRRLEALGYKE